MLWVFCKFWGFVRAETDWQSWMWLPQSLSVFQAIQAAEESPRGLELQAHFSILCLAVGTSWTDPGGPCQQTLSILVSFLQLNQRGRLWSAAKVLSHTATLNRSFQNLISFWNTLVLVNERRKSLLFLSFTFFSWLVYLHTVISAFVSHQHSGAQVFWQLTQPTEDQSSI